jgi:uncharacterized membrane protein
MRFDINDGLIVAGVGMVLAGTWLIYPLALLIIGGLFLLAIGLARAINKGKKQ